MNRDKLGVEQFARIFGVEAQTITDACRERIEQHDFHYTALEGEQLEAQLLTILKRIEEDRQVIGAPERTQVWHDGWQENLSEFRNSGNNLSALAPKFFRPDQAVRLWQKLVLPDNSRFELDFVGVYRQWFLETYFSDVEHLYEFGCGTGHNLVDAATILPGVALYGSDFVQSSVDLVNAAARSGGFQLQAELFDMLNPREDYRLCSNAGVFTFGSLEQLASDLEPMLEYLVAQSPRIVVHTEPAIELYDSNNLLDYLAIKFQGRRGYSSGLLARLKEMEQQGRIEILKIKRLYFGSLFMEGYNLFVWRPL